MEEKLFDSEFFKKLQNINLNLRKNMNLGASGARKSRSKGTSVEFSDYREYTFGDDFRRIDWNAYGRFDRYFVKLFMEEREALVNIFIDSSKSMDFGQPKKGEAALKLAAAFSYLSLNNLDRICINNLKNSEVSQSENLSGKITFQKALGYLSNVNFSGKTDLNASIKRKPITNRGICIIISDFFTESSIEESMKYLIYKKQEVLLVHMLSEEELNPEFYGQMKLIDSESGIERFVALTPAVIKEYRKQLALFTNSLKELSVKLGVSYIQVSSSDPLEKIIFEKLSKTGILTSS